MQNFFMFQGSRLHQRHLSEHWLQRVSQLLDIARRRKEQREGKLWNRIASVMCFWYKSVLTRNSPNAKKSGLGSKVLYQCHIVLEHIDSS